jgi:hypothetical protein
MAQGEQAAECFERPRSDRCREAFDQQIRTQQCAIEIDHERRFERRVAGNRVTRRIDDNPGRGEGFLVTQLPRPRERRGLEIYHTLSHEESSSTTAVALQTLMPRSIGWVLVDVR